jgi:hypothetical protein
LIQLKVQENWICAPDGKCCGVAVNVGVVEVQFTLCVEQTVVVVPVIVTEGAGAGVIVTVAGPDFVGSATEVAVTVTLADAPPPGTVVGAV